MSTALSQDVVDQLLVSKGLLARIRFHPPADPDRISLAQAILTAHDAAELAIAAIARHLNVLPSAKQTYFMDYFPAIQKTHQDGEVPGRDFFSKLNSVRVNIKHLGVFPDPQQWYRVGERTYDYVSGWCQQYLELSFEELDQSALIVDQSVKDFFDHSKNAFQQKQYKESLEYLAYAMQTLFNSNKALRNLVVGAPRAEDAIKLATFGVHANDYLALQEFLPGVINRENNLVTMWDQKKFGHPGNWREDAVEFALKTFIEVALRIQNATWIPGAIEFDSLYEHKIYSFRGWS
jgi:hypothetical protein